MIEALNITKKFGQTVAVNNISYTVDKGKVYGMVGSNGAGKSTLLRVIAGVYKPESGNVKIDGEDAYNNTNAKSRLIYVSDEVFYHSNYTLEKMAKLYSSLFNTFDYEKFRNISNELNLDTKKSINSFSKGMKRQAVTILALAVKPDYYLFDETFDGLDPVVRNYIKKLICEDVLDRSVSAVITSHSLRELEDTCDQLALLHKGGIVLESDIQNLKTASFKIQFSLPYEYDTSILGDIEIVNWKKEGSVSNIIVKGDKDIIEKKIKELGPNLFEIIPMTLEEVFTFEMETMGYRFNLD